MKLRLPSKLLAALLATMLVPTAFADDSGKTLNLYILTGQSNSLGAIYGSYAEDYDYYASDILYWQGSSASGGAYLNEAMKSNPQWATVARGAYSTNNTTCLGPEYGFAYMMSKKGWNVGNGDDIRIIKVSCDGGSNDRWQASNVFYTQGVLQHIKDAINAISERDLANYSSINIAGLLYLQGESNNNSEQYKEAATRYEAFLAQLKSDLAAAGYGPEILNKLTIIPVNVAGEPATWDGNATKTSDSNKTSNELMTLAGTREDMGWVFTHDLDKSTGSGAGGVHYGEKAQITIGARFAYAIAVQEGKNVGTVRNDRYDGCGAYPAVEDTSYGSTTALHYSLNDAGAWWNGAAPTANDVLTWDVSSANQVNGETISADLAVKGLLVEDPYNSVILIKNLGSGDHTLSVGSAGITAQRSDLTIDTKLAVTADQDWTINRGHTLNVNGTLSGDHVVTIAGNDAEGRSTVNIAQMAATGGPSFTLGDNIDLNLSSASDTVSIGALTLGSGDVINLGGDSCVSLSIGNMQAASGGTFNLNLSNTNVYDNLTLGAGSSLDGNFVFNIAVGSAITIGGTFTLVHNWAGDATYTASYTGLGSGMNTNFAVQDGNLVLTIISVAGMNYSKPWATGEQTAYTGVTNFNSVCANADNVKVTSTPASGNVYVFTAATNLTTTTGKYAELDSGSHATWVGAVGTNSSSDNRVVNGDMFMKVTGTGNQTYTRAFGVANSTLNGSAYLEMDAANATFTEVTSVFQSSVSGSVTMVFKAGTFGTNSTQILGGTNNHNLKSTVGEGVYMQFEGGTFNGIVYGGSTSPGSGAETTPTISKGTHLLVKQGSNATFNQSIYGGNNDANAIVDGGVEMVLAGSTMKKAVYGGNNTAGTIKGGVNMVLAGGTYSESIYGGNASGGSIENGVQVIATDGMVLTNGKLVVGGNNTGGSISGGVNMLVDGGCYTSIYGGNASGGSISGGIQMTISGGIYYRSNNVGMISGAGNGGTVEGDVSVTIKGGDFHYWNSQAKCGIYAGSVSGGATVTGNASIVLKDIDNTNSFVATDTRYTGKLSGKHYSDATSASISGTSTLVLDHYAADAVYASLQDFDAISAINGTNTTFGTTNRGGTNDFSIDSTSTINFTNANANLGTLHGTGRAVVSGNGGGANTAFSFGDDWTGSVVISGTQVGVEYDFDNFGHAGSTIELQGLGFGSGGKRMLVGDKSYDANIKLVGGGDNIGLFLQKVEADATYTFNGAWSGSGDFEMRQDDATWGSATFVFNGDMSGFSGKFLSNGAITLQFGNGGNGITKGSVSGTGEFNGKNSANGHTLKVVYNYANDVSAGNTYKGNLQLVKQGTGTLVITTQENTFTGGTLIEGGKIQLQSLGCLGNSPVTVKTGGALQVNNFTLTAGTTGDSVLTLPATNDGSGIWTDMNAVGNVSLAAGADFKVTGAVSLKSADFTGAATISLKNTGSTASNLTTDGFVLTGSADGLTALSGVATTSSIAGTASNFGSLTLGAGAKLDLTGTMELGTLTIGSGASLTFSTTAALNVANGITATGAVQVGLTNAPRPTEALTWTIGTGWAGVDVTSSNAWYTASVNEAGQLVLATTHTTAQQTWEAPTTAKASGTSNDYIVTSGETAVGNTVNVASNGTGSTSMQYYAVKSNGATMNGKDVYVEVQDTSANWLVGVGGKNSTESKYDGNVNLRSVAAEDSSATVTYNSVFGAQNAGQTNDKQLNVYLELSNANATYGTGVVGTKDQEWKGVIGAFQATLDKATIVVNDGNVGTVVGVHRGSDLGTFDLEINGGTVKEVYGAGLGSNNTNYKSEIGDVNITLNGGTITNNLQGGAMNEFVERKEGATTNIAIYGGTVKGDIYGNTADTLGGTVSIYTDMADYDHAIKAETINLDGVSTLGSASLTATNLKLTDSHVTLNNLTLDGESKSLTLGEGSDVTLADNTSQKQVTMAVNGEAAEATMQKATINADSVSGTEGAKIRNAVLTFGKVSQAEDSPASGISVMDLSGAGDTPDYTLQNVELDNTLIQLADDSTLALSNVVLSADSGVVGDGTASLTNTTQKLDNTSITATTVTTVGGANAIDVTMASHLLTGSLTGTLALQIDQSFLDKLMSTYPNETINKVVLTFGESTDFSGIVAENDLTATAPGTFNPVVATTYGTVGNQLVLTFSDNIPEPATGTLGMLALAALASRRRRK